MTNTKKAIINGYEIKEESECWGTKVIRKYVTIDNKHTNMTYTQACNWAKKTDRSKT